MLGSMVARSRAYVKMWWDKDPVIVVSYGIGIAGTVLLLVSPGTYAKEKYYDNYPNIENFYNLKPKPSNRFEEEFPADGSNKNNWPTDKFYV